MTQVNKPRIAAIDDDPSMLRLIGLAPTRLYDVTAYGDPLTALEAFRAGNIPDLVISDVMMPQMVGFDLHERARELPHMRAVPFLFLSAMSDRLHQRRAMSQGADDYITKPFRAEELRQAVAVRLERARSLRDRARDARIGIASLGGLDITFQGRRLQWEARKAPLLLLCLLRSDRQMSLRDLLGNLWSEPVQDNTIRVLINRARRMLDGIADIVVRDEMAFLELDHPVDWDARTFEDAAVAALPTLDPVRIEAAIRLYSGDFLPDFDAPWVDSERAQLEDVYLALLEAAVEAASGEAEAERARARLEAWYGN